MLRERFLQLEDILINSAILLKRREYAIFVVKILLKEK